MSFSLRMLDIQSRASLVTSTIIRDITKRVVVCPDTVTSICKFDLAILERNLFDDTLLIVWASSASDSSLYKQFKRDSDNEDLSLMSNEGHTCYHLFNTSESQLWTDGVRFYGLSCPRNVSGFLEFEETCYLDQCTGFINTVLTTYSKSFIECSPLVVLWLSEAQLDPWFVYLIFGRNYVYLSNDNLTVFIGRFRGTKG